MGGLFLVDHNGHILVERNANDVPREEPVTDARTLMTELAKVAEAEARKASTLNKRECQ